MSLIDNPVEWAESRAGSRKIYLLLIATQIVLGFIAIFVSRKGEFAAAMTFGILLFGIAYPCMYLYALRSVLTEYRSLKPPK
jgi:hypothetical protein